MLTRKELASKVLEVFPSFSELMNDYVSYEIDKILFKEEILQFKKSNEWEGVALAVDKISSYMNGHVFWDNYDFDDKGDEGSATIIDGLRKKHKVDFTTFRALILLFYISSINMRINHDQYLAWKNFTDDEEIRTILEGDELGHSEY
jgi:hypothetical protein